jgi:hypothetical protein
VFLNYPCKFLYTITPDSREYTLLRCDCSAAVWRCREFDCRYLRNVSVEGDQGKPNVEFTQDGVLKAAELKIMNLRPGVSKQLVWEEVSTKLWCNLEQNTCTGIPRVMLRLTALFRLKADIRSFCSLSYDRSVVSCKASSPQGAI